MTVERPKLDLLLNERAEVIRNRRQLEAQMLTDQAPELRDLRQKFSDKIDRLDADIAKGEMQQAGEPPKEDGLWGKFLNGLGRGLDEVFALIDGGARARRAEWHSLAQEKSDLERKPKDPEAQAQLRQTNSRIAELAERQLMTTGYSELGKP